jgi:hypothetical protein
MLVLGVLALTGVALVLTLSLWSYREGYPDAPDGVRCFDKTESVPVSQGDNVGWIKPGYQVRPFVRLKSGEIVAPVLRVVRPNFRGFLGGVRHDPTWEANPHFLGDGQAKLDLPVHVDIDQDLVLVRRVRSAELSGQDSWRLWVFGPEDGRRGLVMPRFETMELLGDRKDAAALLEKDQKASAFATQLNQ